MIYTKKVELTEAVQAGYRAILKKLEDQIGPLSQDKSDTKTVGSADDTIDSVQTGRSGSMTLVPTPPETAKDTRSKVRSRDARFITGKNEGPNIHVSSPYSNNQFTMSLPLTPPSKNFRKRKETACEELVVMQNDTGKTSSTGRGKRRRVVDNHAGEGRTKRG